MSKGKAHGGTSGSAAAAARPVMLGLLLVAAAGTALLRSAHEGGSMDGHQEEITVVTATRRSGRHLSPRTFRRRRLVVGNPTTTISPWHDSDPSSSSSSSSQDTTTWAQHMHSLLASWMNKQGDGTGNSTSEGGSDTSASTPTDTPIASNTTTVSDDFEADWGVPLEPAVLKDQGKVANVVGGSDAGPFEAPYFVMFMGWSDANNQWEFTGCGGTLISDRHVLTAGHCASGRDPRNDAAYVHAYQPFWGNPGVPFHYSKVLSYTVHPQFDDGPNKNDVAIATLQKPVDPAKFRPVQLAPTSLQLHDGDSAKVYGLGRLAYRSREQVKTLQVVNLPFLSRNSCQRSYGSQVLEDMVCTAGGDRDACNGDSGGPLVATRNGVPYQVAVVSWGKGCGLKSQPGVYASTQYHRAWIRGQVCGGTAQSPLCYDSAYGSSPASADALVLGQVDQASDPASQDRTTKKGSGRTCRRRRATGESCTRSRQCCSRSCRSVGSSGRTCE